MAMYTFILIAEVLLQLVLATARNSRRRLEVAILHACPVALTPIEDEAVTVDRQRRLVRDTLRPESTPVRYAVYPLVATVTQG